jgi:tetratricopeptide (TPR) repeat protein
MGSLFVRRALGPRSRLFCGVQRVLVGSLCLVGCSKSSGPPDDGNKTPNEGGVAQGSTPSPGPSIYARGETFAPAPAADNAWAERVKKTSFVRQADDLATEAKALQAQGDFAGADAKLGEYLAVQTQWHGDKSDFVKAAKSRLAENRWLASLSPADRKQLKQAGQIEAEAESENTLGHFDTALSKGLDAIRIYQQVGAQNTADYGRLALFIADKYVLTGDFKSAAQAYSRGLAVTEQTDGVASPVYGNALLAMSGMWMNRGDYVEAMKTLERACEVFALLGEEETSAAYCLMMIGVIHKEVGDFAEAEKLLSQALQRAESLGPRGKSIAGECLQHLAGVYYRAQNYSQAESTQLKAMQVLQEALGESPVLIGCRSRLARIYVKTGQLDKAESMLKNAIASSKEAFGNASPISSYATQYLGELYVAQHDYAAAEPLLSQALAAREKGHGADHPAIAEVLEPYCTALRGLGRTSEAEQLAARKKAIDSNSVAMHEKLAALSTKLIAERPAPRN